MSPTQHSPNIVTVRVPATSGNVGPGFDTLGIALALYNRIQLKRVSGKGVTWTSSVAGTARPQATEMVTGAARAFFRRSGCERFGVEIALTGDVPVARGLGSSVTVRLGVMAALNVMSGQPLSPGDLLESLTALEHHPDNAAPAIYGGFAVSGTVGKEVRCLRYPIRRSVQFVTLVPRFEVSTEEARRLVPEFYTKHDTVHNLNRVGLISAAFARGRYETLRGIFDDRVHQPYREALIPQLSRVLRAGEQAGAIGGWLSGSGSTIICMTLQKPDAVARAMQRELPESDVRILRADNQGYKVIKRE